MKRALVFLAAFAVPVVPLMACKSSAQQEAPAGGKGGRGGGGMSRFGDGGGLTFPVDMVQAKAQPVEYIVTAPGTIEAFEHVQVTARVAGVVDKVAFREGQDVKSGDALVIVDSERYVLAVNSAKAAVDKAKASEQDTQAQVQRRETASASHPGLIAGEEVETYRTKTLTAKADTEVAQEALKTAQLNMRDSVVRAPMDGVIQTRTVDTGQYVNAGTVLATLLQSNPLLLKFDVEPQDAPRLKVGMMAAFTMRETQQSFQAKITLVAGAADPTTHMVAIQGEINADKKYWLRPGSFCDVSIDVGSPRLSPVIPRGALHATDHGYVLYVVDPATSIAKQVVVQTGMSTNYGWIEIKDGLKDGDWYVVHGADALQDGSHVKATQLLGLPDGGLESDPSQPQPMGGGGGGGGGGGHDGGAMHGGRDGGGGRGAKQ